MLLSASAGNRSAMRDPCTPDGTMHAVIREPAATAWLVPEANDGGRGSGLARTRHGADTAHPLAGGGAHPTRELRGVVLDVPEVRELVLAPTVDTPR